MNWPKLVRSVRSAAVFFVLAMSLPAQKLSFLHSVDASSPATPGIAADSTGVYMVDLSGRHLSCTSLILAATSCGQANRAKRTGSRR